MNQDYNKPAFKKLLHKLQEESWQLELIISGFAIFGLFSAIDPLKLGFVDAANKQELYKTVIHLILYVSCGILLFNLLFHVLLRGLWIGALGLRYVSGDIDYDHLNYSEKFSNYLQKKVGSFDKYISKLENYCSVIFAISFLLIFYVLALTFTIITIALIANFVISNDDLPSWVSKGIGITLILFIVFGMFFTFIDFITQGFLKKKKWLSKLYFPVYWVFSFITLSFLYRPLVYNFLDNKFGKRLSFMLIPIYAVILFILSLEYNKSNYFKDDMVSTNYIASSRNYEDLLDEHTLINNASIQSKIITDNYVKVFILFSESIENRVFNLNPSLKPKDDFRGLKSKIQVSSNRNSIGRGIDSLRAEYVKAFNEIYSIKIDSLKQKSDFVIAYSKKNELGFETYINAKNLVLGKHVLKVNRMRIRKGDTTYWRIAKIPFWYYPD